MDVESRNCTALRFLAERNIGSSETNPEFSDYCQGGKLTVVNIPLLQDPRPLLQALVSGSAPRNKQFRKNIFKYNNALCIASVHANWVNQG